MDDGWEHPHFRKAPFKYMGWNVDVFHGPALTFEPLPAIFAAGAPVDGGRFPKISWNLIRKISPDWSDIHPNIRHVIITIKPSSCSCFGNLAHELGQQLLTISLEFRDSLWVISPAQLRIVVQVLLGEDLAEDELDYLRTNLRASSQQAMVALPRKKHAACCVSLGCWHVPTEGSWFVPVLNSFKVYLYILSYYTYVYIYIHVCIYYPFLYMHIYIYIHMILKCIYIYIHSNIHDIKLTCHTMSWLPCTFAILPSWTLNQVWTASNASKGFWKLGDPKSLSNPMFG